MYVIYTTVGANDKNTLQRDKISSIIIGTHNNIIILYWIRVYNYYCNIYILKLQKHYRTN